MAMTGVILVTPEQLNNAASAFKSQGENVRRITSQMISIADRVCGQWEGEASQAYHTKFHGLEDDIQRMINMITEHVDDLMEMSRIYSDAETQNLSDIETLSSDVIV